MTRLIALLLCAWLSGAPGWAADFYRDAKTKLLPVTQAQDGLRVEFYGVTSMLITDGTGHLLVDGYFSRPRVQVPRLPVVRPEFHKIERALDRLDLAAKLCASADCPSHDNKLLVPVHGHYDHALDSPYVAARLNMQLLVYPAIRNVFEATHRLLQKPGFAQYRRDMRRVSRWTADAPAPPLGDMVLRLFDNPHIVTSIHERYDNADVAPFDFPTRLFGLPEGQSYAVHVTHGRRSLLLLPSAGEHKDELKGARADVVFLSFGGLGTMDRAYWDRFWEAAVVGTCARRVIPVHWSNEAAPYLDVRRNFTPLLLGRPGRVYEHYAMRAAAEGREMVFAPPHAPFDPFADLPPPVGGCS